MRRLLCTAALVSISLFTAVCRAGDQEVAEEIKYNLKDVLQNYHVGIKVQDGTAWLNGSVSNERQMSSAVAIAYQTPGVQLVVNNLTINGQSQGGSPRQSSSNLRQPSSISTAIRGGIPPASEDNRPLAYQSAPVRRQGVIQASIELPEHAQQELRVAGPVQDMPEDSMPMNPANRGNGYANRRAAPIRDYPAYPPAVSDNEPGYAQTDSGYMPSNQSFGQSSMASAQRSPAALRPARQQQPLALAAANPMNFRSSAPQNGDGEVIGAPQPMPAASPLGPGQPAPYHYDSPHMPGYAWPSYAAYPNYAAVTYPKQYSPTAWPYIGPFYPYPQVPLGWRKVSLEWKDGWWFLDFKDSH